MGQKLIIGPITKGQRKDREAFVIDNDSFPTLINALQWRGRVKRKRGTSPLCRLQRIIGTTDVSGDITVTILPIPIPLATAVFQIGTEIFVDPGTTANPGDQILLTNSAGAIHKLNRVTGLLTITGSTASTSVIYFPALPVMGEEEYAVSTEAFPGTIAFDTRYAYNILTTTPYTPVDISFYNNPATATYPNYVAKGSSTALWWNGQDYQQFWSTNYQGAFWATNGITVPFVGATTGMQFAPKATIARTATATTTTTIEVTIAGSPLEIGDFVYFNEWTGSNAADLNFQTGYVTAAAAGVYMITFPQAVLTAAGNYIPGIIQYLTNRSSTTKDCIRFYDGSGWVNFMPPLSQGSYVINDTPEAVYYLVNARMIVPFKDRLLFFGPVIQTSTGNPIYLPDTCVYSQNGTAYYTSSFMGDPLKTNTQFLGILIPTNQTATATAYWEDQFGFGGFTAAGIDQNITTVSTNEDALIVGFNQSIQTRFVYTGNDILPFQFYIINAELGSNSTFSAVNMDEGVLSRGPRGFITTNQSSCARIDLENPDEVFEIKNTNNGSERFTSQRDFQNEWVYFTYPCNQFNYNFPTKTFFYNYRDESWAIFHETYTNYGTFKPKTGFTWATIGQKYPTWNAWTAPWNTGASNLLQTIVIAGNQQGYIVQRDSGTGEAPSLYIQNIAGNIITSTNHCLNNGDYIVINSALGNVSSQVNGKVFKVLVITNNTFSLSPSISSATYQGSGTITRMYIPKIYSKEFPTGWDMGRKTRLGVQQYLFTSTLRSQVTLLIFLSTNITDAFNESLIEPDSQAINSGLIYSTVLYTCQESTNLGLSAYNANLLNINEIGSNGSSSNNQQQIWHRMNTSLIGDTVQFGFTLNEAQMRDPTLTHQFAEIEFHGAILDLNPAGLLA